MENTNVRIFKEWAGYNIDENKLFFDPELNAFVKAETIVKALDVPYYGFGTTTMLNSSGLVSALEDSDESFAKVFAYVISETSPETNCFYCSREEIAKNAKVGLSTVSRIFKILYNADIIRRVNICNYMFNPKIVYNGEACDERNIRNEYLKLKKVSLSDPLPQE